MLHLGDITKINGADVPAVNAIIGGSPCQDLSVAGKRAGLSGERSGLFMEQLRIIKEMRRKDIENGAVIPRPRYMVWENVPGAFSSNKGEDFRIVLEETAKVVEPTAAIPRPEKGKWANAGAIVGDGWSIAWRVLDAQFWGVPQRRRRIALVADFGGQSAPEILFERKGVSRYTPPSRTPWETFAAALAKRFGGADKARGNSEFCNGIIALDRAAFNQGENALWNPKITDDGINSTLTSKGPSAVCAAFSSKAGSKSGSIAYREEQSPTLRSSLLDTSVLKYCDSTVRRLTPLECERLQGFPDGWTDIGDYIDTKGKKRKTSDSARYKALGNSIALPSWVWVLERLSYFCGGDRSMASLFDGIGGFPLIWETLNGKSTCLWASEIEEFPIAVTKRHFS